MIEEIIKKYKNQNSNLKNNVLSTFSESRVEKKTLLQLNTIIRLKNLPKDLILFWSYHKSAILYEDIDYGQWGLKILSPKEVIEKTLEMQELREDVFFYGDIVIGEFLGDSQLLVFKRNEYGIFIALPIDPRHEWPKVGNNFLDFLEKYYKNEGKMFWDF